MECQYKLYDQSLVVANEVVSLLQRNEATVEFHPFIDLEE